MDTMSANLKAYDSMTSEAGLLSEEEQLRLAADASDIGWWDVEEGYGRLFWPPRVKAMFGISAGASVSMDDFSNGLHPDDRDRVMAAYVATVDPARRAVYDVEYRTIGKEDGVVRWVAAKGRGLFDETGRCKRVIGTAIDITTRINLQQQELANGREDTALREQFLAVLAHDLRNPLASVAAGIQLLLQNPKNAGEIAAVMERSIVRMTDLIGTLLDLARSRLSDGLIISRNSEQPLKPVLLHVIDELKHLYPVHHITVDIDLREPVQCDRLRIGQLFSNLLGNAFEYGTPTAPVHVRSRAEGGQFELSVINYGPAIEPSHLERLFQPYFRGNVRGSRDGLGLGLYICSEIAEGHGGTISVSSESGTTSFTLRMPTHA